MKKPKLNLNFGDGGFQGWLVRHCEKIVLGVVALLALLVIWSGFSLAGLGDGKSPDNLMAKANEKRADISKTSWGEMKPSREKPHNVGRTIDVQEKDKIDPLKYRLPNPMDKKHFAQLGKRKDPDILAPVHLKIVPIVGAIAYLQPKNYKDPLEGDDVEPQRKPRPRPKPKARGNDPMGMGMGMAGGRGRGRRGPMGGAEEEMGIDMGAMDEAAGGGAMEMDAMGAEAGGMLGMPGGGMGGGVPSDGQFQAPAGSMLKTKYGVVVMALVPHEKQWEEYENTFNLAFDPDAMRDRPSYRSFFAQRADVTDDPDADPDSLDWKAVSVTSSAVYNEFDKWAGIPADVMDPAYLEYVDYDVEAKHRTRIGLTHPLPPFVQRDLWDAMTHPEIRLASAAGMNFEESAPLDDAAPADDSGDEVPGGIPSGGRRGGAAGIGGAMDGVGMMGGGMMGPGMRGGGRPRTGGMGMPGGGMMGMPGMAGGVRRGRPGMGMDEMGAGGNEGVGMGGVMGGVMGGMMGQSGPQVKYKLIRFTDFTVEPGRKYRYKVGVILDDPNHPPNAYVAPSPGALDDTVLARLSKADPKVTYLVSPPSAMSDVVSLPSLDRFFAGKVVPESSQEFVKDTRPVRQRDAEASVLALVHDPVKGADFPVELKVGRGSAVSLKKTITIEHPVDGSPRSFKDYEVQTDAVVADIMGGDALSVLNSKVRDEKMTAPGEVLIVDAEGNLIVQDEAEDVEDFQRFVPSEEEDKPGPAEDAGAGGLYGNPMDPGALGVPGGGRPPGR